MREAFAGVFCLAFLVVVIAPANVGAQHSPAPHFTRSRSYTEDPYMGWNKGKTWGELMEEFYNAPVVESAFKTITRTHTYHLTALDSPRSSEAIALEQIKQSVVSELIEQMAAGAKAGRNVSKKVYGKSSGISYELLPGREAIGVILPSTILVEKMDEDRAEDGKLVLKAGTRVALSRIVPLISAISKRSSAREESRDVRRMATDAMREIQQMQEATIEPGERIAFDLRYSTAVDNLIAANRLEEARYFALHGQVQDAISAYTEALETVPGLAIAYRNRGGIRLYLGENAAARADFINAYISDAIDHAESGDYQACIGDTEAALTLAKDYPKAYFHRAVCRFGLDRQDLAMADLKRAAQLGEERARKLLRDRSIEW